MNMEAIVSSSIVKIIAGIERREFHVHEHVLKGSESPALVALITGPWRESHERMVDWSDIGSSVVLSGINFLYRGTYDSDDNMTESTAYDQTIHHIQVHIFADRYLLTELKKSTAASVVNYLNEETTKPKDLIDLTNYVNIYTDLLTNQNAYIADILIEVIADRILALPDGEETFEGLLEAIPTLAVKICFRMKHLRDDEKAAHSVVEFQTSHIGINMLCGTCHSTEPVTLGEINEGLKGEQETVKCPNCDAPVLTTIIE